MSKKYIYIYIYIYQQPNLTSKFKTRNLVEINNDLRGMYSYDSQVTFKTSTLQLSLCDYSDVYIQVKVTKVITNTRTAEVLLY